MAEMFLKLMKEGDQLIQGESLDGLLSQDEHGLSLDKDAHFGEIEIRDWNWKIQNKTVALEDAAAAAGGAKNATGTSKLDIYNITLQKYCDFASANLLRYCLSGEPFPKAQITCRRNFGDGKHVYLLIELTKVKIHHVELKGMDSGQVVNEEIQLQFGTFEVYYIQQLNPGIAGRTIPLGWDVEHDKEFEGHAAPPTR
jgi:type VI protein secretion system component Hcp